MDIAYVSDPVLWPKLRCAKCQGKVRQMRESLSGKESLVIFLCGEPLAWLVIGVGAVVGYLAEATALVFFAWAVLFPIRLVWLHLSHLRRASFLCSACGHISGYAQARMSARLWQLRSSGQ